MQVHLLKGRYSSAQALELLSALVQVKIDFHHKLIDQSMNEEDIKVRERRIIELHKELSEVRALLSQAQGSIDLHASVDVELT